MADTFGIQNLARAEPLMQVTGAVAQLGDQVQQVTGDLSGTLDALLAKLPTTASVRAQIGSLFETASDPADLAAKLKTSPIPQRAKADLGKLKAAAPKAVPAATDGWTPVDEPADTSGWTPVEEAAAPQAAPERTWGDTAADLLPTVGGVIGGMVGKVPGVRMATAAIGGAAGEGYRQIAKHASELPGAVVDVARNLVNEPAATVSGFVEGAKEGATNAAAQGAIQAAGQGGGELLGGAASKAAPFLMNRALNLTAKLSREFPNLSTTMIEHALSVSKTGLGHARMLLTKATAEAHAALATAHAAGATVPVTAATRGLQRTLVKVLNGSDIESGLATLAAVERKIGTGRAGALNPIEADALKRSLQTESKALYAAEKMGNGKPNTTVKAQALADMAASLNEDIGAITTKAGAAGYRAANAAAEEMIGATRGIENAIRPGSNLYQAMVRPGVGAVMGASAGGAADGWKGAAAGTVAGAALTSPAGMSRLAIILSKPSVQGILKRSPQLAAAVASFMAEQEQP